tara:strand:- start:565 stop:1272 length:708 start_codon:yes stop_codon:yes gene_type:complete
MSTYNPIAISSIHYKHTELGAAMEEIAGWEMPAKYSSTQDEIDAAKRSVVVGDISFKGKFIVHTQIIDNTQFDSFLGGNAPPILSTSATQLSLNKNQVDVLIARLASDEIFVLTDSNDRHAVSKILTSNPEECIHTIDVTSSLAGLNILGPSSHSLLSELTEIDISSDVFPDMVCAQGKVADIAATILRCDRSGFPGFEVYFARDFGEYMWETFIHSGQSYDAIPIGFEGMNSFG